MPSPLTYPGVYIEEVPSGVRTITGVATSITAFLGVADRGPTDEPVLISSFSEFERRFGGLALHSTMSYAVRDFFANGGRQALVVRLYAVSITDADRDGATEAAKQTAAAIAGATDLNDAVAKAKAKAATFAGDANTAKAKAAASVVAAVEAAAKVPGAKLPEVEKAAEAAILSAVPISLAKIDANGLPLVAVSNGRWGNQLQARVVKEATGFRLLIRDAGTGTLEDFRSLSVDPADKNFVRLVLENRSALMRVPPGALTAPGPHQDPPKGKTLWGTDPESKTNFSGVLPAGMADDGGELTAAANFLKDQAGHKGLFALEKADIFNLLCIPPYREDGDIEYATLADDVAAYCKKRRAMFIIDSPAGWTEAAMATANLGTIGQPSENAALFFPRLQEANPLHQNQLEIYVSCGAVAGVIARTDGERGVWKAPAGIDATLSGVTALSVLLNDSENGDLNKVGINCLRALPPYGRLVWGARTRKGSDRLASEWKYIPVRRTALFIEESLYRGTKWVVFEPNDEPLWAQIRLNIGVFMHGLFRQGAFQGTSPRDAYFVKCDKETTTQDDINKGIVNVVVGFAPLKPAEFIVIRLQQLAGQIDV